VIYVNFANLQLPKQQSVTLVMLVGVKNQHLKQNRAGSEICAAFF
jgi:glycine cleavage system pyridoxal-binding protein P